MPISSFFITANSLFPKHLSTVLYMNFSLNFWFLNVGSRRSRQYFRSCCSTVSHSYLNTFLLLLGLSCLAWPGFCLCKGGPHWQLRVVHVFLSSFTSLTHLRHYQLMRAPFTAAMVSVPQRTSFYFILFL